MDIVDLDTDQLEAGLADGSILLVDVREPHEHENGMIPGSVPMPLSTFDPAALPPANGRRVVFSCRSGVRSRTALERMNAAGHDLREHYAPGFSGWLRSGGAVTYHSD